MTTKTQKRRWLGDREAVIVLTIFAAFCAMPGVRAAIRGEAFDVPTSVATALSILALALLVTQLRQRARRRDATSGKTREHDDGASP